MSLLSKLSKVMSEQFSKVFQISNIFQAHAFWYAFSKTKTQSKFIQEAFGEGWQKFTEKYPAVAEQLTNILVEFSPKESQKRLSVRFTEMNPKELEAFQKILRSFPEASDVLMEQFRQGKKMVITLPKDFLEKNLTKSELAIFKELAKTPKGETTLKTIIANPKQYKQFVEAQTAGKVAEMLWLLKETGDVDALISGKIPTRINELDRIIKEKVLEPLLVAAKDQTTSNYGVVHKILSGAAEEFFGEASPKNIQRLSRIIGTLYTEAGSEHVMLLGSYFRQFATAYEAGPEKVTGQLEDVSKHLFALFRNPSLGEYLKTESINITRYLGALSGAIFQNAQQNPELVQLVQGLARLTKQASSPTELTKQILLGDIRRQFASKRSLLNILEADIEKTTKNIIFSAHAASLLPENLRLGILTERLALLPHELVTNFETVTKTSFYPAKNITLTDIIQGADITFKVRMPSVKMKEGAASQFLGQSQITFGPTYKKEELMRSVEQAIAHYYGLDLNEAGMVGEYTPQLIRQLAEIQNKFPGKLGTIQKLTGMALYTGAEPIHPEQWDTAKIIERMFEEADFTRRMYLTNLRLVKRAPISEEEVATFQRIIAQAKDIDLQIVKETVTRPQERIIKVEDVMKEQLIESAAVDKQKYEAARAQYLSAEQAARPQPPKPTAEEVAQQEIIEETAKNIENEKNIIENQKRIAEQSEATTPPPKEIPKEKVKQETFEEAQKNAEYTQEKINQETFNEEVSREQPMETPKDTPPKEETREKVNEQSAQQETQSLWEVMRDWGALHKRSLAITGASVAGLMTIGALTRAHHREKLADIQASLYHTLRTNYAELQSFKPSPIMMTSYQYTPQQEGYHNGYEVYGIPQATYRSRAAF